MTVDKPLRLFVAASVPEAQLLRLQEETASLRERWPGARWSVVTNQHVTLRFLGSTPPDRLDAIGEACRSIVAAQQPATLRLGGLGVFPNPRRARVLWAGLVDPTETLTKVVSGLDRALAPFGYESEKRELTPHVTLARFRDPVRVEDLPQPALASEDFLLSGVGLWRSHLSPRGARYERLREFAFGDSA